MTSMIEKVARAMCEAYQPYLPEEQEERLEADWNTNKPRYMTEARAAIQAMREPTPEMLIDAGAIDGVNTDKEHVEWWRAMIDAALKDTDNNKGEG